MKINKKLFILVSICSYISIYACQCDYDVHYAMDKQRNTIKSRLNDFLSVVKANTKQTENQTLIIKQEVLAYRRLLARIRKETMMLKEALFITTTIKMNSELNVAIELER